MNRLTCALWWMLVAVGVVVIITLLFMIMAAPCFPGITPECKLEWNIQ